MHARTSRQRPSGQGIAARTLRRSGTWSVVLGGISVAAGCLWSPVDLVLTVLGVALIGTGVWTMRAPRPTVVAIDAVVLVLVGGWNAFSATIGMVDGLPPSPGRAILGLVQILLGVRRFRKFGGLFHGGSFDDEKQAIHQVVGAIRKAANTDVAGLMEFESGGLRRRKWKARIQGDRVVIEEGRGRRRLIGTRATLSIRVFPEKVPGGPREAEISVGATRIRTKMSAKALHMLAEWKAGRSTRAAA